MFGRIVRGIISLVGAATLAYGPQAQGEPLVSPNQLFNGQSQAELANAWWQWGLSFPTPGNPLVDPTEAFSQLGDLGPVFFLSATTGNATVSRTATIRSDQAVFVPLFPFITWNEFSAYHPGTYDNLRRDVAETAGIDPSGNAPLTTLFATFDGSPLTLPAGTTSLLDFRQFSPALFDLSIPANNAFGLTDPIYPGTFPSVADGWWLLLSPLTPGQHTLHFGGTTTGIGAYAGQTIFSDVTYSITVSTIPEPSTLSLAAVGGLSLLGYTWKGRRKRALLTELA